MRAATDGGIAGLPSTDPAADASAPMTDNAPSTPGVLSSPLSSVTEKWWNYDRPAEFDAASSAVQVPMRDGIHIGCNLMRPAKSGAAVAGQFPSLVAQFTPYLLAGDGFAAEASFFVERGYNALICTLRGVGNSEGTWQGAGAAQDFRDAYDLVEWFATQPYADGRVGQYGHSYGGFTSWGAAVEQAPHLRAAAPLQPAGSIYDDVIYPGGIESTPAGDLNAWPTIAELVSLGAVVAQEEYDTYHAHSTFDAYWKERAFVDRHADVKVPLLIVGGWTDQYFRAGTIRLIEATAEHAWGIYGPFPHIMPVALDRDCSFCASDPLPAGVLLAWFDHWLMERADAPIPPKPTFVSYESPIGAGDGWRELSAWIPQDHDIVTYQLGSDGILSEVLGPTGTLKFHEPGEPTETNASLSFATKPLDRDRVLLGYARIDLRAKLTASDANFYVELFDIDQDDQETLVNDGFLKASHRESHIMPTTVTPNEVTQYQLNVRPAHYRFKAGHRVRLRISGGFQNTLLPPSPVDVEVTTDASTTLRMPGFAAAP